MIGTAQRPRWELRVRRGRAVLVDRPERVGERPVREYDPAQLALPPELVEDLHEWAHVVEAVAPDQDIAGESSATLMARRGRQLAARLAAETGGDVGYWDPARGRMNRVRRAAPAVPEPTPWATGSAIAVVIAALVTVSLVVVSRGLGEVNLLLAVLVNVVVVGGFAPSIWIGRRLPVWRWVAFGAAAGVVLAWLSLLLSLLG
ncbi:DUF2537 domain-containing protein [Saccharopolyspora sp. NPDC047091]|uniref:DUF2537 domain-containing protein n=1 Tax=Saccharopolyspora sp. NPDC047091 TaxID=3155924 RepID=UPI0033CA31E5